MIETLMRKARSLAADPVLRRWVVMRALGRAKAPRRFAAHRPPYLDGLLPLAEEAPAPPRPFAEMADGAADRPIILPLPGGAVTLRPGEEASLFERPFADPETMLAVHRFAWLPLLGAAVPDAWVAALWRAWRERAGELGEGWAWHPYTAAERAVNLLAHARRRGLPAPAAATLSLLARHAPAIARRLEYFGEHHTSNHLANDGRGLYLIGLALGLPRAAEAGARILTAEAGRLFRPSGVLREGSSHYHLLLARTYVEAWLAARAHGRPEAGELEAVAARALAVVPALTLPGGLALVGDVSPDSPPPFLTALMPGGPSRAAWAALLEDDERAAVMALRARADTADPDALAADGWLRLAHGPWSGLWHLAPGGWPPMPGHGHQDAGGFELHHGDDALFVDPGRGAYGDDGEAALDRSGLRHNTLLVDGADPYPPNRPYYDDAFRRRVAGPPPELARTADGVRVRHHGFARIAGVGAAARRWSFADGAMTIDDAVEGSGQRRITRLLHTALPVERAGDGVVVRTRRAAFRIAAEGTLSLVPAKRWIAYGEGLPATAIRIDQTVSLPFRARLTVTVA